MSKDLWPRLRQGRLETESSPKAWSTRLPPLAFVPPLGPNLQRGRTV